MVAQMIQAEQITEAISAYINDFKCLNRIGSTIRINHVTEAGER